MRGDERLGRECECVTRFLCVPERGGNRLIDGAVGTCPVAFSPRDAAQLIENERDRGLVARLRGAAVKCVQQRSGGIELACPHVEQGEQPARLTDDVPARALRLESESAIKTCAIDAPTPQEVEQRDIRKRSCESRRVTQLLGVGDGGAGVPRGRLEVAGHLARPGEIVLDLRADQRLSSRLLKRLGQQVDPRQIVLMCAHP
jgi:hypothetical protein